MAYPSLPNEEPFPHFLLPFRFQFHFSQFLQKPLSPSPLTRYLSPTTPFHGASLFFPYFHHKTRKIRFCWSFQLWACVGFGLVSGNCLPLSTVQRRASVVCEAAPKKKVDSAVKRTRQAEDRRIYNKARKSEIKTRTKKVEPLCYVIGVVLVWVMFQLNGLTGELAFFV